MGIRNNLIAATIANGASLSGAVFLGSGTLIRIQMPAAWTAAVLSFQTSDDGVTYQDHYDDANNEINIAVAASRSIQVSPDILQGALWIKVRSGLTAAAVNQAAARVLTLVATKFTRGA